MKGKAQTKERLELEPEPTPTPEPMPEPKPETPQATSSEPQVPHPGFEIVCLRCKSNGIVVETSPGEFMLTCWTCKATSIRSA